MCTRVRTHHVGCRVHCVHEHVGHVGCAWGRGFEHSVATIRSGFKRSGLVQVCGRARHGVRARFQRVGYGACTLGSMITRVCGTQVFGLTVSITCAALLVNTTLADVAKQAANIAVL